MYTRIGMLLGQHAVLYARLSGYQNLKSYQLYTDCLTMEIIEVLKRELNYWRIKIKQCFRECPKAMQQRLTFAKAILSKPEILFWMDH